MSEASIECEEKLLLGHHLPILEAIGWSEIEQIRTSHGSTINRVNDGYVTLVPIHTKLPTYRPLSLAAAHGS